MVGENMDAYKLRKDFLIYKNNPDLVYMDTGATSLKPFRVLAKMNEYYYDYGVNIHRGVYKLSYLATDQYDLARNKIAKFINAKDEEIVFLRNASEALNFVSLTYGEANLTEGDEVITSELDHHSCFLPWMKLCEKKKATLKYIPLTEDGRVTIENFKKVLSNKTKVVAIHYYSNVFGFRSPIEEIIKLAHEVGAVVIVDAAQAVAHTKVDVKELDCDFLAFSGHKMLGPMGIGILYGKKKLLKKLDPLYYGGDMNDEVSKNKVEVKEIPYRFETGTPAVAEAIGLGEAVDYINELGLENIHKYTKELYNYTIEKLQNIKGITIYNKNPELPIIAFNINGVHPHDAATLFDEANICLRAGHHCAQLLTKWLGVTGTLRGSFYIYNTIEDCDKFINTVIDAVKFFEKINGESYE